MGWIWTAIGIYLLVLALMFVFQRTLLYPASQQAPDLAAAGLSAVTLESADGLELRHGYRPPDDPEGPVVVVFHGNAGHIGHRDDKFTALTRAGVGLLLVEYRGYGGNPGSPNEADILEDGRRALAWLAAEGVAPARTLIYGESLGSGPAVKLAALQAQTRPANPGHPRPFAGVILEAPYTSIAAVAQGRYWFLPAKWLLLDKWDVRTAIGEIDTDLLVFHGARDRTVPMRLGRRLFDLAEEPKQGLFLDEGDHNNLWDLPEVSEQVLGFVRRRVPMAGIGEAAGAQ